MRHAHRSGSLRPRVRSVTEYSFESARFEHERAGAYYPAALLADADLDGVYAHLAAPLHFAAIPARRSAQWIIVVTRFVTRNSVERCGWKPLLRATSRLLLLVGGIVLCGTLEPGPAIEGSQATSKWFRSCSQAAWDALATKLGSEYGSRGYEREYALPAEGDDHTQLDVAELAAQVAVMRT